MNLGYSGGPGGTVPTNPVSEPKRLTLFDELRDLHAELDQTNSLLWQINNAVVGANSPTSGETHQTNTIDGLVYFLYSIAKENHRLVINLRDRIGEK